MPHRSVANYVRTPAVAGAFYPDDHAELHSVVSRLLESSAAARHPAKALIVPHAGYVYSGGVAAAAYAGLRGRREITTVVLIGPAHRVMFRGLATSSADAFSTPLGHVPLDKEAIARALTLPQVQILDEAHADEHSLEVQLPFLMEALGEFKLVPFVLGNVEPEEVSALLDLLWGGPETLIVISSDLSHYHNSESAQLLDAGTTGAIEALDPDGISSEGACGHKAIAALLSVARQRGLRARTLQLANSGDSGGDRARVVGYGAYAFEEPAD